MVVSPLTLMELLCLAYLVADDGVIADGGGSSILIFDAPANNDKRFGRTSFTWPQLNTSYMDVDIRCKSTVLFTRQICIVILSCFFFLGSY